MKRGRKWLSLIPLLLATLALAAACGPSQAERHVNQGIEFHKQGRLDDALSEFDRAIELDPKLAKAYGNRGWVYWQRGELDKALADLDRAIELDPLLAMARAVRALVYQEMAKAPATPAKP
jgi:tetratricopeptide (TPR) repeat protein